MFRNRPRNFETIDKCIKFGMSKIEPGDNFEEVYIKWKNNELTAVNAMKLLYLKSNTFYRRVKEYEFRK